MSSRTRTLCAVAAAVVVLLALAVWLVRTRSYAITVRISAADLQRAVDRAFPIEKQELLLSIRLSDPRILLTDGSDRIGLGVSVAASVPGVKPVSGRIAVDGRPRYDPNTGALYLDDPKTRSVVIQGISEQDAALVQSAVGPALETYLRGTPVYRLTPSDVSRATARAMLRSVAVRGERLVLVFGPPG